MHGKLSRGLHVDNTAALEGIGAGTPKACIYGRGKVPVCAYFVFLHHFFKARRILHDNRYTSNRGLALALTMMPSRAFQFSPSLPQPGMPWRATAPISGGAPTTNTTHYGSWPKGPPSRTSSLPTGQPTPQWPSAVRQCPWRWRPKASVPPSRCRLSLSHSRSLLRSRSKARRRSRRRAATLWLTTLAWPAMGSLRHRLPRPTTASHSRPTPTSK